jgi:hypothetical protein
MNVFFVAEGGSCSLDSLCLWRQILSKNDFFKMSAVFFLFSNEFGSTTLFFLGMDFIIIFASITVQVQGGSDKIQNFKFLQ